MIFFSSLNPNLKFLCHISHINFSNCILSKTPEIYNFMHSVQFYFSELWKISLIYFSISKILIKKIKYYLSKCFQILDIKINIYRLIILFSFLTWWKYIKYFKIIFYLINFQFDGIPSKKIYKKWIIHNLD